MDRRPVRVTGSWFDKSIWCSSLLILGEGFDTFYGVKQGDPLSTDLFGIMIEILYEYLNLVYPDMGVKIGSKYISGKLH